MQIKRIECPSCGIVLDIKNNNNATEKIFACPKCKIQLKVKFKPIIAPNEPVEAHTYLGGRKQREQPKQQQSQQRPRQNSYETQLGGGAASRGSSSYETQLGGGAASRGSSSYETQLGGGAKNREGSPDETQLGGRENHSQYIAETAVLTYNAQRYTLSNGRNIIGRRAHTVQASIQIPTDDNSMSRQHCCIDVTEMPNGKKKVVLRNYKNKNATSINGVIMDNSDIIRLYDGDEIKMGNTKLTFKLF